MGTSETGKVFSGQRALKRRTNRRAGCVYRHRPALEVPQSRFRLPWLDPHDSHRQCCNFHNTWSTCGLGDIDTIDSEKRVARASQLGNAKPRDWVRWKLTCRFKLERAQIQGIRSPHLVPFIGTTVLVTMKSGQRSCALQLAWEKQTGKSPKDYQRDSSFRSVNPNEPRRQQRCFAIYSPCARRFARLRAAP